MCFGRDGRISTNPYRGCNPRRYWEVTKEERKHTPMTVLHTHSEVPGAGPGDPRREAKNLGSALGVQPHRALIHLGANGRRAVKTI